MMIPVFSDAATGYVRPRISYFEASGAGSSSTAAAFLGGGFALGATGNQEFEIEIGWASWTRDTHGIDDGGHDYRGHSENELVPILLNYRFNLGSAERFGAYVEIGVGAAPVSIDWTIEHEEGAPILGSERDTGVVAALGGGVRWKLATSTSLMLGLRYLAVRVPYDGLTDDYEVTGIDGDALSVEAGLRFSF